MSALAELIAGVLVIGKEVIRLFVNVNMEPASNEFTNCGVANIMTGELTICGEALIDQLGQLIYGGIALLNQLVMGAGVINL